MQSADTVYNSTTLPSLKPTHNRRNYLDNISYASLNPKRCANVIIVVSGVLLVIAGLSMILYGALFYASVSVESGRGNHHRSRPAHTAAAEESRRQQLANYLVLVYVGIPVGVVGAMLWLVYLYRTGRCRYCPLCPGARRRRRFRNNFEQQCLEAGNISNSYARHPTTTLPLDEQQRLVQLDSSNTTANESHNRSEETDSILMKETRPVIKGIQTTI